MPIRAAALFEAHLPVRDLTRSVRFYRDVVGLTLAYEAVDRGGAFFWVGAPQQSMLGLWSTGSMPMGLIQHVAFSVAPEAVFDAPRVLTELGIVPLSFDEEPTIEPSVMAWMPAASVFFKDPDGHLLEYLTILDAEPRPQLGVMPWSAWLAQTGSAEH